MSVALNEQSQANSSTSTSFNLPIFQTCSDARLASPPPPPFVVHTATVFQKPTDLLLDYTCPLRIAIGLLYKCADFPYNFPLPCASLQSFCA